MMIFTPNEASKYLQAIVIHERINSGTNIQDFAMACYRLKSRAEAAERELANTKKRLEDAVGEIANLKDTRQKPWDEIDRLRAKASQAERALAELQDRTRWIPVSERLPENGQEILALGRSKTVDNWLFYQAVEGVFRMEYTHWMPLPEPPEKGGE